VETTPSPAALTVSNADSKAILAAFEKYNQAYVDAYNTGNADDAQFLAAGGGNGAGLQASLRETFGKDGLIAAIAPGQKGPEWSHPHVDYVDSNSSIAAVTSCFNARGWTVVPKDNPVVSPTNTAMPTPDPNGPPPPNPPHPIYPGDGAGAYTVLTLLNRTPSGAWTVVQTSAQPDQPC
jgi:hypothetical protein